MTQKQKIKKTTKVRKIKGKIKNEGQTTKTDTQKEKLKSRRNMETEERTKKERHLRGKSIQ